MKVGIIGGGHNGLVLAGYLAKGGYDVTIFEARDRVGGLCVNEEIFPGHTISTVATYYGMFRPQIIADLELERHGLRPYLTHPAEVVLMPDQKYLFTPRDGSESLHSVGELYSDDLEGWQRFWTDMSKGAELIGPFYHKPKTTRQDLVEVLRKKRLDILADNLFDGSLFGVLEKYLDNDYFKAAAATCTPGFATSKGSVFGCMHHGTAETCGVKGAWGLVRGGMGMISEALEKSARASGVKIRTKCSVKKIRLENGKATGLELTEHAFEPFDLIVSNADPLTTFSKLLPETLYPKVVDATESAQGESTLKEISKHLSERSHATPAQVSAGKVHLLLKRLPVFPTLEKLNHNYAGIIVVAPAVRDIVADSKRVPQGHMPENLMMTMAFPTVTDDTVAPFGEHHMNIDIHYLPLRNEGKRWNDDSKEIILRAVFDSLKKHAPDIEDVVLDSYVVSPEDLRQRFGVGSALCWHLPMTSEFVFEKRVMPGCDPYRTPIDNVYLCGAGTYGGGNVTGVAGYNCARVMQKNKVGSKR